MDDYIKELKVRFREENFKNEIDKKTAIEKAYADMSRRAKGHKSEMKDRIVKWLFEEVFNTAFDFNSQDDFDKWNKKICIELKERHGESFGRIGRSQKVINMAFKYLSCVDDTYDKVLCYCHMTLDSYTLNWYKTIDKSWNLEWSNIDDYEQYATIQRNICNYLNNGSHKYSVKLGMINTKEIELPNCPFEAEYIIWEGEKINKKYNELIRELNKYKNQGKENDKWLIENLFDEFLIKYTDNHTE